MALSQREVEEFMAAEKVVPGSQAITWTQPEAGGQGMWRGPIEVAGERVGELFLLANPAHERAWCFKLSLRGEDVYRLDVKPAPHGHNNPRTRPSAFPAKVKSPVHEHVYVEDLDCKCALPVGELTSSDHAAIFQWFCARTHVRIEPKYRPPQLFHQMPML